MYYLVYIPLYLLSLLPWFFMYRLSDFLTFLVWRVFPYRKDVVLSNLAIAFPEKTEEERLKIAKDFYRLFCDTLVESIKLLSLSTKGVMKKFTGDATPINDIMASGKSLQIMAMHNFNWEIVNHNVAMQLKYPFIGVYGPLSNKIFERMFRDIRSRYGTILIPAPQFRNDFRQWMDKQYILALVADQNPPRKDVGYWFPFFSKETPFIKGPETGAKLQDTAVVFGHFFPLKRGHYSFTWKLVTEDPRSLPDGELTRLFKDYCEDCIRKYPANYLWTHRRWKHSRG